MPLLIRLSSSLGLASALLLFAGGAAALTEVVPSQTAAAGSSSPPPVEQAPSSGLRPDQIYAVLVGEIAGRRGDLATAFEHYYRAAELTRSTEMAELAVRAAISADDSASADRGIRLWLEIDPESSSAHQVAAFVRIKAGDQEGALIHLGRLVDLSGDNDEVAFSKAAAILARLPSSEQRVSMMQALAERYADRAEAQHSLAMVAASASELDVAEEAARRAMELRPEWNAPRLFLVRLLISEDKRDEARVLLEGFVSASPDDHALRMLYGQFLVEEEEFTTARDVFERMLRNQPKEPDVLFAVGILSLQLEDLDGARLYFTRLYETGERKGEAAFYLGQTAEQAEDVPAALDWYGRVDGANSDDAQVRIALLKAKRGEVAQAREILQRLRSESPENAVPLFMVEAEILDEVGRPDDVLAVYDAALSGFPDHTSLLYARGLYLVKQGKIDAGEQDLRRIIEAQPDHADALNALGYTLADRTTRYEEARELIERAYALKPDEPAILDSMGWVNYRLGNFETALDYLQRAAEEMEDGEISAHLGEVLWALGRRADAWAVWDQAIKAYPDHAYLHEVVGRHSVSRTEDSASSAVQRPAK
ncbi:tetratricopeptide repeat protein [Thiorhodococcus mannitoliphagus]|uniref:Tetratricopeptide repeat protein n=1 Tax=Thiorhodococcus mannitoliphagus TaxID=329406 RepID=A0A6P1DZD8_9GAMM|nr:tetratricopeptide repeat protein [Thiorhodococcus mannitoliphagus]NEX22106.1 tetratricopeptide repeat protein [Thiorhodococcus mannitoliphagus]